MPGISAVRVVAFGCDHRGAALRHAIFQELSRLKIKPAFDFGTDSTIDRVDYPIPAEEVCKLIKSVAVDAGILVCGSGIGMSMVANRLGTRAALCRSEYDARMARQHNNAEVLCLGADVTAPALAAAIVNVFLTTSFDNGSNHARRIEMLNEMEAL